MMLRAFGLVALGLATLAPVPAQAKDDFVFAECQAGGCECRLSGISLEDVEVITTIPTPPGAKDMVLVYHDGTFIWSNLLPDDLDLLMGGDGRCPIEVFDIRPEDGTWTGTVRVQSMTGCLPEVATMVPPLVDAMGYSRQIAWGGGFHPARLALGAAPDRLVWRALSSTQFEGTIPVPSNGTLDVDVRTTATLTAADTAEATMALRISAAEGTNAAALAMIGMADCRVDAVYDFQRVGP